MTNAYDELEIEGKRQLTTEQFQQLCNEYKPESTTFITQHNHYFDTVDFQMKERNSALRIREKNDSCTLTLKTKTSEGSLEKHDVITQKMWKQNKELTSLKESRILTWLAEEWNLSSEQFIYLGTLTTHRAEWGGEGGRFFLDKNEYLDVVDYELEFEGTSNEHVELTLEKIVDAHQLSNQTVEPDPKIKRFFDRKTILQKKL